MKKTRSNLITLRSRPGGNVKLREAEETGGVILDGYGAVFNSESEVMWDFVEIIREGAFTKTLSENKDICALNQHLTHQVLARTPGNLVLAEDEHGLRCEITVEPKITYAMDLIHSIRRGDVYQMSFGFRPIKYRWTYTDEGEPDICEVLEAALLEVSPVTFPAYRATSIGERDMELEGLERRSALGCERAAAALAEYANQTPETEPGEPHSDEPTTSHSLSPALRLRQIEIKRRKLNLCEVTE